MPRVEHRILVHFFPQAYSYDWSRVLELFKHIHEAYMFLVNTGAKIDRPRVYLKWDEPFHHIVYIYCHTAIPLCADYARVLHAILSTRYGHIPGVEYDVEVR